MSADTETAAVDTALGGGLQRLLDATETDRAGTVVTCRPLSGGYSRMTARAEVRWGDGTVEPFILRADPPEGDEVFHSDRDAEWRLLVALADAGDATVAIPQPRWYDGDGTYFGTKCMVIDFREGTPMQALAQDPAAVPGLVDTFVETGAKLHATPLDLLPDDMERSPDWDAHIDAMIDSYVTLERSLADATPLVRYMASWLRAHKPDPVPLGLLHGDFQPGNVLAAPGQTPLVIDWEFGRIGDPREDLGYYVQIPMTPNLYKTDPDRFLGRYRELSGLSADDVNRETTQFFLLIAMAPLYAQMAEAADRLARGGRGGAMTLYLLNALSHQRSEYLDVSRRWR